VHNTQTLGRSLGQLQCMTPTAEGPWCPGPDGLYECCVPQVYLYINSPGGIVTSGLAIYDTMQVQGTQAVGNRCHGVGLPAMLGASLHGPCALATAHRSGAGQ